MSELDGPGALRQQRPTIWLWLAWVVANTVGGVLGGATIEGGGTAGVVLFGAAIGICQWLVLRRYVADIGLWVVATTLGGVLGWAMVPVIGFVVTLLLFLLSFLMQLGSTAGTAPAGGAPALSTTGAEFFYRLVAAVGGAGAGMAVGLMQWGVLKRPVRSAGWWIAISAAGGAVAAALVGFDLYGRLVERTLEILIPGRQGAEFTVPPRPSAILNGAVFGAAYALISGGGLLWLLRRRIT